MALFFTDIDVMSWECGVHPFSKLVLIKRKGTTIINHSPNIEMKFIWILSVLLWSTSEAQWSRIAEIPETRIASALLVVHDTLYVATDSVLYVGANGGTTWFVGIQPAIQKDVISCLVKYNSVIVIGTYHNGVFKSSDEGISWEPYSSGLAGLGATDIGGLLVRRDSIVAGTYGEGLFATAADFSQPWGSLGDSISNYQGDNVYKMLMIGNTLLANAGGNGYMFRYTDAQPWWNPIPINSPHRLVGQVVTGMASDATDVFAGTNAGMYQSTDEGLSWTRVNFTDPPSTVRELLLFHGSTLYALTSTPDSSSLFSSSDEGENWKSLGVFPLPNVFDIAMVGDTFYMGRAGGVWKASLSQLTTTVLDKAALPHAFKLHQNYPNPFNPTTKIGFEIGNFGFVSLKIYDVLGREVTALVNEVKRPGIYEILFDANGLASGTYFYRLKIGEFTETKRLTLVR